MSLLLCRREPVVHPYFIEVLGIHVYSSQELCYVIWNHPLLVMEEFLDESLIAFIRQDLDLDFLAGRMEKLMETGSRPEEVLLLFLSECDYYSERELQKFKEETALYRKMKPVQYEKARADELFRQRQFGRAALRYEKLLNPETGEKLEKRFEASVYRNLGASYAMMFQFAKALQAYGKSYALEPDEDVPKRIYFLTQFAPDLELSDQYRRMLQSGRTEEWRREAAQARMDAEQAEEVRAVRALFKKGPEERMSSAARMVSDWKREYRKMI